MATNLSKAHFKILGTNEPVPAGYICLGERWPAKTPTARDRERIRRGIADKHIDAYRRMRFVGDDDGPIYVCESDAIKWLATYQHADAESSNPQAKRLAAEHSDGQFEAAVIALCEINNGITLMHGLLERLACAVEAIATQPKTPHQELLQTFSTNGFHS
jgi:hypothetical protein